ncbi:MAG: hypothetical protein RR255_00415 [Bacilli bacterium]
MYKNLRLKNYKCKNDLKNIECCYNCRTVDEKTDKDGNVTLYCRGKYTVDETVESHICQYFRKDETYISGILRTYDTNATAISCKAELKFKNNIVEYSKFRGVVRGQNIDGWFKLYKKYKEGDKIRADDIKKILKYNGKNDIVSEFEEEEM